MIGEGSLDIRARAILIAALPVIVMAGLLIFFFEPKHPLTLMDVPKWQLLGAMCLNKTAILPPDFCLMQTAHDPGSVRTADGIDARITEFAARIAKIQTVQK